ncbi:MAG: cytochrome c [Roseivirga sp.]|nr:cytochrome c [Roseivirga sp.]
MNKIILQFSALGLFLATSALQDNNLEASKIRGEKLYTGLCQGCHKPDGSGYTKNKLSPPLAGSDYLLKNKENGIQAVLFGLKGKVIVNDVEYDRAMPPVKWTDQELSDVLNYVRNTWGNKASFISPEEIAEAREKKQETDK